MTTGYSGTPLARKLGMQPGARVLLIEPPPNYTALLQPLPDAVRFVDEADPSVDLVHCFVTRRDALRQQLVALRQQLRADTPIWVSWPKKASKVATELTEDVIRELALPLGFVDIKVCAVSEVWSGLKIVVREALR